MKKASLLDQQNQMIFNSLKGEEKMNFFIGFFVGNLVSSMKAERKRMNLTQEQLAERMNVKQAYISKIEKLDKIPTLETVGKYLFALDCSLEEAAEIAVFLVETDNSVVSYNFKDMVSNPEKENAFGGYMRAPRAIACGRN